ncbi:MAG: DUF1611 domain-containing protein [Methanobacteriota archaeon]|nr:MAG: DUF1611 domain-containing protein [Euryarchaeota archaeon]
MDTAIILCEGGFGTPAGKTAAGLIRHSLRFKIVGIVDSTQAGKDAGEVIDGKRNEIPVFSSVRDALSKLPEKPEFMIIGIATIGGMLPEEFRQPVKDAIEGGVNMMSGLHEWLADDEELSTLAAKSGVTLHDIRREPPLKKLHKYKDLVRKLNCVRIPVLGTDAAIGKRTTAITLTKAMNDRGIKTTFVATGQTGLMQGSKYGIPLDAIRGDYVVGELEHAIVTAYEEEKPQLIIIEGQGAMSHPAYVTGSRAIISASQPQTVVLQHAPGRRFRSYTDDVPHLPIGTIEQESELIRVFGGCDVIGITINPESLEREDVVRVIAEYEQKYGLPTCDVLADGPGKIVDAIVKRFFSEE